jgi:hypothetical protein
MQKKSKYPKAIAKNALGDLSLTSSAQEDKKIPATNPSNFKSSLLTSIPHLKQKAPHLRLEVSLLLFWLMLTLPGLLT